MITFLLTLALAAPSPTTETASACATEVALGVQHWFHHEMTVVEHNRLGNLLEGGKWPKMVRFLNNRGLFDQPHCPDNLARLAVKNRGWRDLLITTFRQVTNHSEYPGLFQDHHAARSNSAIRAS